MCGRFASVLPPELIARLFRTNGDLPNIPASWNVAPTQAAMVVRRHPASGERRLDALSWGLVPHFTKHLKAGHSKAGPRPINARAETAASSGMFRGAFAARRCLVPADAFYEWLTMPDGKQPFAIARQDGELLALAGLWESWRDSAGEILRSFAILTTSANAEMAALHARMPVVLEPVDWPLWLGESKGDPASLCRPAPDGTLRLWPVSRRVNNVRNNEADLLQPVDHPTRAPDGGTNPA